MSRNALWTDEAITAAALWLDESVADSALWADENFVVLSPLLSEAGLNLLTESNQNILATT